MSDLLRAATVVLLPIALTMIRVGWRLLTGRYWIERVPYPGLHVDLRTGKLVATTHKSVLRDRGPA